MSKAQLITIGTEIVSGEIVNTNASWVSQRLEECGLRVLSHLSVRDQRVEILNALKFSEEHEYVVVTGGLGPTTDDITRSCLAEYTNSPLEFDEGVWAAMERFYQERGLPLRAAHRIQCHFPKNSRRLSNPVGTALGFVQEFEGRHYFVLPGPPRELEGMWLAEVAPELKRLQPESGLTWRRWTCLGAPESEVAELVERALSAAGLEVGYRASVPYVKVKLFCDAGIPEHQKVIEKITNVLSPFLVGEGDVDLAEELLRVWPLPTLLVSDTFCENVLLSRFFVARANLQKSGVQTPQLDFSFQSRPRSDFEQGIAVEANGENFTVTMVAGEKFIREVKSLPYKVKLSSERGRISVAEWVLWSCVKALRA